MKKILEKYKKFFLLLFLFTVIFSNDLSASNKIKIIKKVNSEIITNFDVLKELNYLTALNNSLENLSLVDQLKIAEESVIREKIKYSEITKFIDVENFNNIKLIDRVMLNLINDLGLNNKSEFENYLLNFQVTSLDVKKKITIEVLWNQLISSKYKDKINIDENELLNRIKKQNLDNKNILEYDLSEIIFQVKNREELETKIKLIDQNILEIGFKNTANKFSISNTSKLGGKVGKVKENQLSKKILNELNNINVGEYTKPIKIGNGFMILLINDKKIISQKIDENVLLNNMIEFEKQKQFDSFSQIYFNKVKINSQIYEF